MQTFPFFSPSPKLTALNWIFSYRKMYHFANIFLSKNESPTVIYISLFLFVLFSCFGVWSRTRNPLYYLNTEENTISSPRSLQSKLTRMNLWSKSMSLVCSGIVAKPNLKQQLIQNAAIPSGMLENKELSAYWERYIQHQECYFGFWRANKFLCSLCPSAMFRQNVKHLLN